MNFDVNFEHKYYQAYFYTLYYFFLKFTQTTIDCYILKKRVGNGKMDEIKPPPDEEGFY